MAEKIGFDGKLYRNTGTYGTPVWNEVKAVRDLRAPVEVAEHDVSSRKSRLKISLPGLVALGVEFDMVHDKAEDDYTVLRDASMNGTLLEYAVMDENIATSGSDGWRMTCGLYGFGRNEPLEGGMTHDVVLKPAPSANAPAVYTVP